MQTVLITGGTKGIGKATVIKFQAMGFRVLALGRDFLRFDVDSDRVERIKFDLREIASIPDLVQGLKGIDILINNAGILHGISYSEYTPQLQDDILKTNLEAPIALIREVSRQMIERGSGRIVNNTSVAGHTGHADIWYGITKAGLINATKSFAPILAPYNIVVTAIASGPVGTEMLKRVSTSRMELFRQSANHDRFATPEEIASAMYWLATEAPEQLSGSCMDINDGVFPR
jgi:3-oxoacyl-[acyl-carrier protein] reductase